MLLTDFWGEGLGVVRAVQWYPSLRAKVRAALQQPPVAPKKAMVGFVVS